MRKILSLTAAILLSSVVFSQGGQMFDIRGYGGYTITQLTTDNTSSIIDGALHERSVTGRPGYQAGVSLTFGNRFFVQPGFQHSKISTKIVNKNTVTGTELVDETSLSVVSVPLKFGFRLIDPQTENLINVRIFGGFDGHHVTGVKHSNKSGAFDNIDETDYHNLIVNADFGLGLDVWFLFAEAGYQLGLTPVHTSGDTARANAFYANLGLKLTFGK